MSDRQARLFVAVELPASVRASLAGWATAALMGAGGWRSMAPESIHLTLCFLGWRAEDDIAAIGECCREAIGSTAALALSLGEVTRLPPRRPRVLAVAVADGDGRLVDLQAALERALASRGWYEPEGRAYLAHVTVARAGRSASRLPSELTPPAPTAFMATAVTLFRSHLRQSGARYEPLMKVILR